jgi:tetratricopeptide (TPR) repeat protein
MPDLDTWLKIAPKPPERLAGQQWHVFLSYRSVERPWVLSLYDTLTQLGYETFLDQFVLDTASRLPRALEENLDRSQAGILVWSPRSQDSEWCKREYDAFVTKENAGGFRFVIARLGEAVLPLWAQSKLWVDFGEDREGPRGTGLLRLLYGLQGMPLTDKAVRLAVEIDEETRIALARIRAATADPDKGRLLTLAESPLVAWRSSPLLRCACAEALISVGAHTEALAILDTVVREFPKSVRPQQLQGLALARAGRWRDAKNKLGELYELGERDPETVGIYARTWMDSYLATGNLLHLRRSRDLYAEAFKASPSSYYAGINAAAKSILLREPDVAKVFAQQVQALVGDKATPGDYWKTATAAEVQLMQEKFAEAARLYLDAVAMSPGRIDDHRSTLTQANRLLEHLDATNEEVVRVRAAFAHLLLKSVSSSGIEMTIKRTGPRIVHVTDPNDAVGFIRSAGRRVVTFMGFSGGGYEDPERVNGLVRDFLGGLDPGSVIVCSGATEEGIGAVYPIARSLGFATIGIVSSLAVSEHARLSDDAETIYVIEDTDWGGRRGDGTLSPTSVATVGASDEIIAIGGGNIARDEIEAAMAAKKPVRFAVAEMNHASAIEKARRKGAAPPEDFEGPVRQLFKR